MRQSGYIQLALACSLLAPAWPALEALPLTQVPAPNARPSVTLAVTYETTFQLSKGRGLARQLIDSGIGQDDSAAAAKLAAVYLKDGKGGSSAKVAATRLPDVESLRLTRVTLYADSKVVVIERRNGKLAITSERAADHLFWIS